MSHALTLATYVAVAVFAIACLVLAVLNWSKLAAATSSLRLLESEVEKKGREFDQLRKRLAPQEQPSPTVIPNVPLGATEPTIASAPVQMAEPALSSRPAAGPPPASADMTSSAPVVYPAPTSSPPESVEQQQEYVAPAAQVPDQMEIGARDSARSPAQPEERTPEYSSPPLQVSGEDPEGVMDIVADQSSDLTIPAAQEVDTIKVPLYSGTIHDADFAGLRRLLTDALPAMSNPTVQIDFTNILYLYDKELDYLEGILALVQQHGGTMTFIDCSDDLKQALAAKPDLAGMVRDS